MNNFSQLPLAQVSINDMLRTKLDQRRDAIIDSAELKLSRIEASNITKKETIVEEFISKKEFKEIMEDFKNYLLGAENAYSSGESNIEKLKEKFNVDLGKIIRILMALHEDENKEFLENINPSDILNQYLLNRYPIFLRNYQAYFHQDDCTSFSEIIFLIYFLHIKLNFSFDPMSIHNSSTSKFYMNKEVFKEKYYNLFVEYSRGLIDNQLYTHFYAENYKKVISACDKFLGGNEILRHNEFEEKSMRYYLLRGIAKQNLKLRDEGDKDLQTVVKICNDRIPDALAKNDLGTFNKYRLFLAKAEFELGNIDTSLNIVEDIDTSFDFYKHVHETYTPSLLFIDETMILPEVHFLLARIYFVKEKYSESLNQISIALTKQPGYQEYVIFKSMVESKLRFQKFLFMTLNNTHFLYV